MTDHPICPLTHRVDPERPRHATHGRICTGHYQRLTDDLTDMPRLHTQLANHLHTTGSSDHGGRGDDGGINLNPAVVAARDHIRNSLVTWVRIVLEEGPGDYAPSDTLTAMASWLTVRLPWLANQDWTESLCVEWHDNVVEARSLIQPNTTYRVELGACPEMMIDGDTLYHCPGTVVAVMHRTSSRETLPDRVACTIHGDDEDEPHAWGPMQWHALGRRMGRSLHTSAAEAFLDALRGTA